MCRGSISLTWEVPLQVHLIAGVPLIGTPEADASFRLWAQRKQLGLAELGCDASRGWDGCRYNSSVLSAQSNPRLFFYSSRWRNDEAISTVKEVTDAVRAVLPRAHIGANNNPSNYQGEAFQWVRALREGALT